MLPSGSERAVPGCWDAVGTRGVAYWAHVGGFLFGVGAGLALKTLGSRSGSPAELEGDDHARGNPVVEEAAARRAGGEPAGLALLEAELQRKPEDPDVAVASGTPRWRAGARGGGSRARPRDPALLGRQLAADGARLLGGAPSLVPEALVDPTSLLRFVPVLRGEKRFDEASRALRDAVSPTNRELTPAQAVRVVDLARESDPAVAFAAARRALESGELAGPVRAKLEQQLPALEQAAAAAPRVAPPAPAPKPASAPEPAAPERALDFDLPPEEPLPSELDAAAVPALAARFTDVKVADATPTRLDDAGLGLTLPGGRAGRLELPKIQAIAVGTVGGLGPKPVILVDLLLNHSEVAEGPLRLVRLRSDRFDPRQLASGASPLEAFRAFLNELALRTNAALLPDPECFRGGAFAKFADLDTWQREVLKVG